MLGRVLLTNFLQCDPRQFRAALPGLTAALSRRQAKFRDRFLRFSAALRAQLRVMESVCANDRLSTLIRDISEESAKSTIESRAHAVNADFHSTTWTQWLGDRAGHTTGASS